MLPREELLAGSRHPGVLARVVDAAETALRTWEPVRSGFLDPAALEEAEQRLANLSELTLSTEGGHPAAERRRLLLCRAADGQAPDPTAADLLGLDVSGNFLLDPATVAEFREALQQMGCGGEELGDLWLRGDRGAQAIVCGAAVRRLDGRRGRVRTVEVTLEARPIAELRLPAERIPRTLDTVEASLRLDAVASAGYGISRSRMAALIRQGAVRIDWQPVSSPSHLLAEGERVQLEGRGELRILTIQPTRRGRFRISMQRR